MSFANGNKDGVTFCGARSLVLSEPGLISEVDGLWSVQATSSSYNIRDSPIRVVATITLANVDVLTFKYEVEFEVKLKSECDSTVITTKSDINDMKFVKGID